MRKFDELLYRALGHSPASFLIFYLDSDIFDYTSSRMSRAAMIGLLLFKAIVLSVVVFATACVISTWFVMVGAGILYISGIPLDYNGVYVFSVFIMGLSYFVHFMVWSNESDDTYLTKLFKRSCNSFVDAILAGVKFLCSNPIPRVGRIFTRCVPRLSIRQSAAWKFLFDPVKFE